MTNAPADLITCQHYLREQTGLPWDALGIIHGTPQGGGYHEGNDLLTQADRLNTDYSKRESSRDRPGTNSASALDVGDFDVTHPDGRRLTLRGLTAHIVAACQHGDPRARDIREVIYTPDGSTVKRWDRLGIRSSGDDSHLSHTHTSFFRDSEGRRAADDNFLGLLRAYFDGDDMDQRELLLADTGYPARTVAMHLGDVQNLRNWQVVPVGTKTVNPPAPDSPTDLMLKAAQRILSWPTPGTAVLSDAQVASIAKQLADAVIANHDGLQPGDAPVIEAAVGHVLGEVFAAAGHALET